MGRIFLRTWADTPILYKCITSVIESKMVGLARVLRSESWNLGNEKVTWGPPGTGMTEFKGEIEKWGKWDLLHHCSLRPVLASFYKLCTELGMHQREFIVYNKSDTFDFSIISFLNNTIKTLIYFRKDYPQRLIYLFEHTTIAQNRIWFLWWDENRFFLLLSGCSIVIRSVRTC